ncbi:hypothetical protein J6590_102164 [Homalodisca vitripennis]|nr:hypothetical protein J6590_102164 [Homalodisca vitripennis]
MSGGHETSLGQTRGRRSRTYAISSGSCSHDRADRCREDTRRPSGKPGGDDLEHMHYRQEVVVTTEQIDNRSMSGGHETSLGQTRGRRSRTYAKSSGSCSHGRTDRCREDTRRPSGKPGETI